MHSIADIEEGSAAGIAGLKNGEVLACIAFYWLTVILLLFTY